MAFGISTDDGIEIKTEKDKIKSFSAYILALYKIGIFIFVPLNYKTNKTIRRNWIFNYCELRSDSLSFVN